MHFSGREFSETDLATVQTVVATESLRMSRTQLSLRICDLLEWRKPNGTPKDQSCRQALLQMQDEGLVHLPDARPSSRPGRRPFAFVTEPGSPVTGPAGALDLSFDLVASKNESLIWGDFVERYHYLGYRSLAGAQLRYFVRSAGRPIALLAFAAAAWTCAPRDQFIGWSTEQRKAHLQLVVGNARFLILPWVQVRNLASRILGQTVRRLRDDWQARYAYEPVLLETFVERERYAGTCVCFR